MLKNNFYGNLEQLNQNYKLLDSLLIIDTSITTPLLLAKMINIKMEISASRDALPDWFTNHLTEVLKEVI
jgi:hypothetical protein